MHEFSLSSSLMQITDGHPATAAREARREAEHERYSAAERVVLVALLRHAREKSLKERLFGTATAAASNYSLDPSPTTGN
jgi:hypothetical protein